MQKYAKYAAMGLRIVQSDQDFKHYLQENHTHTQQNKQHGSRIKTTQLIKNI
jgi:hypothetical protein